MKGVVQTWADGKGFGTVKGDNDEIFHVRFSVLEGGNSLVEKGEVEFEVDETTTASAGGTRHRKALHVKGPGVRACEGTLTGTVESWHVTLGYGFITHETEGKVYAHYSTVGDGEWARLEVGKEVQFGIQDVGHKSGRKVATTVSGAGVRLRGAHTGTVKRWDWNKHYGFVHTEDDKDIFCHLTSLGVQKGHLTEGGQVFFDIEESSDGTKREVAVNVSGPAVVADEGRAAPGRGGGAFMGFQSRGRGGGRGGGGYGYGGGYVGGYIIRRATPKPVSQKRAQAAAEGRRVLVGSLPDSATWQTLKDHFKAAGTVEYADTLQDHTGVVEYATAEDAKNAVKTLHNSEVC